MKKLQLKIESILNKMQQISKSSFTYLNNLTLVKFLILFFLIYLT